MINRCLIAKLLAISKLVIISFFVRIPPRVSARNLKGLVNKSETVRIASLFCNLDN